MKRNLVFCGHKAHASVVFQTLIKIKQLNIQAVFTDEDNKFCLMDQPPLGEIAKLQGIPVYPSKDLTLKALKLISKTEPIDLMLLTEWKHLLDASSFSFPKLGTFNIHDSLLPQYRGSSVMNWAIINGLGSTGATFYEVISKADSGPIYSQESFKIRADDYAADVLAKMLKVYPTAARKGIKLALGKNKPKAQNEKNATYCAKRWPADGLLDFNWNVKIVYNTIRAISSPFSGAFVYYDGIKVIIQKAVIVKKRYNYVGCIPGALLNAKKVWVLCGEGMLQIEEIYATKNGKVFTNPKKFFVDRSIRLVKH